MTLFLQYMFDENNRATILSIAHDHDYASQHTVNNTVNGSESVTLLSFQKDIFAVNSSHTIDDNILTTLLIDQNFGSLRYDYDEVILHDKK